LIDMGQMSRPIRISYPLRLELYGSAADGMNMYKSIEERHTSCKIKTERAEPAATEWL